MPVYNAKSLNTQNNLLLQNLMEFYKDKEHFDKFIYYINGKSHISLRIIDWFVTNYAKLNFTIYEIKTCDSSTIRFKVYDEYKQKLRAYSKRRFDPFCRWERIQVPFDENTMIETTIGQLNFFKWAIEYQILEYIQENYESIEKDMINRNSSTKHRNTTENSIDSNTSDMTNDSNQESLIVTNKTRKKRQELSISACKCIKKETVKILVKFH